MNSSSDRELKRLRKRNHLLDLAAGLAATFIVFESLVRIAMIIY